MFPIQTPVSFQIHGGYIVRQTFCLINEPTGHDLRLHGHLANTIFDQF
jgi:hypothetical protein